jgi:hypothetical protein
MIKLFSDIIATLDLTARYAFIVGRPCQHLPLHRNRNRGALNLIKTDHQYGTPPQGLILQAG